MEQIQHIGKADPNKGVPTVESSKSPLVLAILHGLPNFVSLLLQNGADCSVTLRVKQPRIQDKQDGKYNSDGSVVNAEEMEEDNDDGMQILDLTMKDVAIMKQNQELIDIIYTHPSCKSIKSVVDENELQQ